MSHAAPPKATVLLAVFFTAFSSIFVRLTTAPALIISFYRMLFAVMMITPYVFIHYRREILQMKRGSFLLCIASGICLALHFATWIASLSMTTVAASTVLVSCSPMIVAAVECLLQQKRPSRALLLGLTLAFCGTLLIAANGSGNLSFSGNLLALTGGFFVAFYFLLGVRVQETASLWTYIFLVYLSAAVTLGLLVTLTQTAFRGYPTSDYLLFAAMAFFCSVLGHTVYNWLLPFHGATLISLSTLCEPVFASLLAYFILREIPPLLTLMGGFLILAGITFYLLKKN
ncbi:MAG: DMT family transporter [Negativicutes bacterium]|nr:DMT family transporter [Negativicutes bacterium]